MILLLPKVLSKSLKQSWSTMMEVFYNRVRKHSYLEYLSPEQFELKSKNDAA